MSLDKATVAKIATLARIRVTEAETETLAGELSKILDWIEQLREVDTETTAPMTSVVDDAFPRRDDTVTDGGYPERVIANAPEPDDSFFTVPKVVE
jgi:aspartyl-tRNA(Asn)/glutamyl-tRNA(Gln) amidotransferase subunit C